MKIFNVKRDDNATSAETKLAGEIIGRTFDHIDDIPDGTRVIVIVSTRVGNRGKCGMAFEGYGDGDEPQVLTDLLMVAKGVGQTCNIELAISDDENGGGP